MEQLITNMDYKDFKWFYHKNIKLIKTVKTLFDTSYTTIMENMGHESKDYNIRKHYIKDDLYNITSFTDYIETITKQVTKELYDQYYNSFITTMNKQIKSIKTRFKCTDQDIRKAYDSRHLYNYYRGVRGENLYLSSLNESDYIYETSSDLDYSGIDILIKGADNHNIAIQIKSLNILGSTHSFHKELNKSYNKAQKYLQQHNMLQTTDYYYVFYDYNKLHKDFEYIYIDSDLNTSTKRQVLFTHEEIKDNNIAIKDDRVYINSLATRRTNDSSVFINNLNSIITSITTTQEVQDNE